MHPEFDVDLIERISKDVLYRQRKGDEYRDNNASRMRATRASAIPTFIGIDSEGIGKGIRHRAVLVGVGSEQYIARDVAKGLHWKEVFEFLYAQYRKAPHAVFCGFYLSYDFNKWLSTLTRKAAYMLLNPRGRELRRMQQPHGGMTHFPVRCDGWEFDMLGFKRLAIRPEGESGWMYVCDAGPFFQMSFINVLNPENWQNDPDGPPCSPSEYDRIVTWKNKRSTFTRITQGMLDYNAEENRLLAVCMARLARGFLKVGIRLRKSQWYGPGATSKVWMKSKGIPKHGMLPNLGMPDWFEEACRKSYFGGWFEIFSHGLIGLRDVTISYNYDINNAYPYAATKLPHLCRNNAYQRGTGIYTGTGEHVLLFATVYAKSDRIGPVPYRNKQGGILRPGIAKGWYWKHEIDAAIRAELVEVIETHEWMEFRPCNHEVPFKDIQFLYDLRLSVGKNSAQGMAIKLNNNSVYGNLAQQKGAAPYNNWFYASYITSHCRTQILDAIATHPGKGNSVLMVATDGICFDSRHPDLPISKLLGEWEETQYKDLFLFKPGVYWHKAGKEALLKVKSRGVPKAEFLEKIDKAEEDFINFKMVDFFSSYEEYLKDNDWPWFLVEVGFRMKSCKQALNEGKWESAGVVLEAFELLQSSDPSIKRRKPYFDYDKQQIRTKIHPGDSQNPETYYHRDVAMPEPLDYGYDLDGGARNGLLEAHAVIRGHSANYDIDLGSIYDD